MAKQVAYFLSVFFLLLGSCFAVEGKPAEKQMDSSDPQKVIANLRSELIQLNNEVATYQSAEHKAKAEYTQRYYKYLAEKADVTIDQFRWQRSASGWLLWLVILVVISGVVFSGVQLWRASSIKDLGGESTIEIEARKVKITSSVVGVIVLSISIVFFYFFLVEVYTIKVVDMSGSEVSPTALQQNRK